MSIDVIFPSNAPAGNPIGVQFYRTTLNKYGFFEPRDENGNIVWSSFARGSLLFDRDPTSHEIRVYGVSFETNDGDNWYVYGAGGALTGNQTYNEDFDVALGSAMFIYSNPYASDLYSGGSVNVKYDHGAQEATVSVSGSGILIPNFYSWFGEAYFQGSAVFKVTLPSEKFDLQVEGAADIDRRTSATIKVFEDYCKQGWQLKITGIALEPDLQGGLQCFWTYPANEASVRVINSIQDNNYFRCQRTSCLWEPFSA